MSGKLRNISISLMAVVILMTSVLALVSHLLCDICTNNMTENVVSLKETPKCCHTSVSDSDDTSDDNEEHCICCIGMIDEISKDYRAEKILTEERFYIDYTLICCVIFDLLEFQQKISDYNIPPADVTQQGRNILTLHSVLII